MRLNNLFNFNYCQSLKFKRIQIKCTNSEIIHLAVITIIPPPPISFQQLVDFEDKLVQNKRPMAFDLNQLVGCL